MRQITSFKEGWIPWSVGDGCDGEAHDGRSISDIAGTGIGAYVGVYNDSGGNMFTRDGDPIANSAYFLLTEGRGHPAASMRIRLSALEPGAYSLKTYHSWGDFSNIKTAAPEGNGVVEIQQATSDEDLIPSVIKFRTDGSAVLVIYEGNCCQMVEDDIRPQRESQRAVLNAFELILDEPRATAGLPTPHDKAVDVPADSALTWLAGSSAVQHDVYFGTDAEAVANATDPNTAPGYGRIDVTTINPGRLQMGTTYYWRVDEINHAQPDSPWKGQLWSFTTAACVNREDFEFYNNSDELQAAWTPGGGALIELQTEQYHQGLRAMELRYYNRSGYKFCEAGMTFDSLQDFSSGVDSIAFYFKGTPSNGADTMYIALEDAAGKSASALYDGFIGDIRTQDWKGWGAKLDRFVGVDLASVKKLFVGVGDRNAARSSRASGVLYIDDVSLCVPSCMDQVRITGDWTQDCVVNFRDHALMAQQWHRNDGPVQPAMPNPAGLKAWYKFDGNTNDSSGNSVNAQLFRKQGNPTPRWDPGKRDNCLYFGLDENNNGVLITEVDNPQSAKVFGAIDQAITIAVWVKGVPNGPDTSNVILKAQQPLSGPTRFIVLEIRTESRTGEMTFKTGLAGRDVVNIPANEHWGQWNHYVFVKDAAEGFQHVYINGCLVAEKNGTTASLAGIGTAAIGLARDNYRDGFIGWLDDFRIYDYPLSQAEILDVMAEGPVGCPLTSRANLYDQEPQGSKIVDFMDYSVFAQNWLTRQLWP